MDNKWCLKFRMKTYWKHTSYGYPGWTCKKITNIYFFESGDGDYENNQRYWYNYGKFNSKNEWVIDKAGIYKNLILFVESN